MRLYRGGILRAADNHLKFENSRSATRVAEMAAAAAVGFAVFAEWPPQWERGWLEVGTNIGLASIAVIIAAAVDRNAIAPWWHANMPAAASRVGSGFRAVAGVLILLAMLVFFFLDNGDGLTASFGYATGMGALYVLAFVLPVCGVVEWRVAIAIVLALFASDWALQSIAAWSVSIPALTAVSSSSSAVAGTDPLLQQIVLTGSRNGATGYRLLPELIACICATLLAVAFAPLWRTRNPAQMRTRRSVIFLFLTLLLLFASVTIGENRLGGFRLLLAAGVAFGMGLIWQVRGVLAAPLIVMLGYLIAIFLTLRGDRAADLVYDIVNVTLVVFPYAYFGFLSNRLRASQSSMSRRTASTRTGLGARA